MFEKLISLLLHAKAGAISGVFLLGATGALISVSTQNGVTTITLTDPSPSPSAVVSPNQVVTTPTLTPTPTATPTDRPAASPETAVTVSPACTDEAKVIALQVQRVDAAFNGFHGDLVKLHGLRDKATLKHADEQLKLVRRSAVRAIHATATTACAKVDDDKDEDKDEAKDVNDDNQAGATNTNDNENKDEDNGKGVTLITFTGSASSIADQAIAAMQTAFDAAKNSPAVTSNSTKKTETPHSPKPSDQRKVMDDHKGEGQRRD